MKANNYPKLRERRFLNATLVYFKISIANVAITLYHGDVPTRMTRSTIVGLLSVLSTVCMYVCMYVVSDRERLTCCGVDSLLVC